MSTNLTSDEKRARLAWLLRERSAGQRSDGAGAREGAATIEGPLSSAQTRIWFFEQLVPGTSSFNIPLVLRLTGVLDAGALDRAFAAVAARHAVLRATVVVRAGDPIQVIGPTMPGPILQTIDLRGFDDAAGRVRAQQLEQDVLRVPFDLARGPLIRARLLRLSDHDYRLVIALHHIAGDAWSVRVLASDLAQAYAAEVADGPKLAPLGVQYVELARQQQQALADGALAEGLSYWCTRLAGAPETTELVTDRPRGTARTGLSATESIVLSATLTRGIRELGRSAGATVFMTLVSAFSCMLVRLTGQSDLVIGMPVSGRPAEAEPLIGCFINTLALRADLSGNPTFLEALARVRETCLSAYRHQDVPFEKVVEELNPKRDPHRTPVFQVLFNMLVPGRSRFEMPGLQAEPEFPDEEASKFDFTFYAQEVDEQLTLRLVYNSGLFTPATARALVDAFEHLLAQVVLDPRRDLASYSVRPPSSSSVLPDPAVALARKPSRGVAAGFLEAARVHAGRVAVASGGRRLTYQDLEARSGVLAGRLRAAGFGREAVAAVYASRGPELVVALLGVLRAGGAFLVLDPAYPTARLARMVEDARAAAFVHLEGAGPVPELLAARIAALPAGSRFVLGSNGVLHGSHNEPGTSVISSTEKNVETNEDADALAYVAFTSGSTGWPKGIAGTLGPLAHFVDWHRERFRFVPEDRFSLLSGLSHDPLLRELFTPLTTGATLVIPSADDLASPERLLAWLREESITVVHITPPLARLVAQAGAGTAPALMVRRVFFGGDVLRWRDVATLRPLVPAAEFVNFYGATETPQAMASFEIPTGDSRIGDPGPVPLGTGIDGVQLLVMNAAGEPCGIGEPGEIWVRTPYLARGYLDGGGTPGRFIANPFAAGPDDRIYRTGDRGRYLSDGTVAVFGRMDGQVKVRGFRIEPAEVESALRAHARVRDAAVVALPDSEGENRLVAYVVADGEVTAGQLRAELERRLPDYMVPALFVTLDALPLTANGKVDRQALPAPDGDRPATAGTFVAPRTETEVLISRLWTEVLGLSEVGALDNFFELGGHSLLATRLMSRLRETLGVELPLSALFDAPTVAELSRQVGALQWARAGVADEHPDMMELEL